MLSQKLLTFPPKETLDQTAEAFYIIMNVIIFH